VQSPALRDVRAAQRVRPKSAFVTCTDSVDDSSHLGPGALASSRERPKTAAMEVFERERWDRWHGKITTVSLEPFVAMALFSLKRRDAHDHPSQLSTHSKRAAQRTFHPGPLCLGERCLDERCVALAGATFHPGRPSGLAHCMTVVWGDRSVAESQAARCFHPTPPAPGVPPRTCKQYSGGTCTACLVSSPPRTPHILHALAHQGLPPLATLTRQCLPPLPDLAKWPASMDAHTSKSGSLVKHSAICKHDLYVVI
jgi:hypothetical protein